MGNFFCCEGKPGKVCIIFLDLSFFFFKVYSLSPKFIVVDLFLEYFSVINDRNPLFLSLLPKGCFVNTVMFHGIEKLSSISNVFCEIEFSLGVTGL